MNGPCEHCGNSDKSKWTTQCIYKGDWPSHRAFVLSTFDPPCACDAYDEGRRELVRDRKVATLKIFAAVVGIAAAIIIATQLF